ncbi:MAG: PatB family C-S lyase [Budvicia sp.]|nr:PatB family C-S lyase [Budvicia sp.]
MSEFDDVILRGIQSRKYGQLVEMFGTNDVLPLWIADMEFATPAPIRLAMQHVVAQPIQGYDLQYPQWEFSISDWYQSQYAVNIDQHWLHYVPGVIKAIVLAILSLTKPDDSVLTFSPIYDPYPNLVNTSGRQLVQSKLIQKDGTFAIDWQDFEDKVQTCRAFLFCSPNNPGGVVWDKDSLRRIAAICKASNTLVIADEIHGDLTLFPQQHIPFFSVSQEASENCIVLSSANKTFNMPGVQGGFAIVPNPDLRERFYGFLDGCYLAETNTLQQAAMVTAFLACREWLAQLKEYLAKNIEYVQQQMKLRCPKITTVYGGASYLLLLDATNLGLEPEQIKAFFIKKARLGLSPGSQYGPGCEYYMRLNVGCPRSMLVEAMDRLAKGYRELSHR